MPPPLRRTAPYNSRGCVSSWPRLSNMYDILYPPETNMAYRQMPHTPHWSTFTMAAVGERNNFLLPSWGLWIILWCDKDKIETGTGCHSRDIRRLSAIFTCINLTVRYSIMNPWSLTAQCQCHLRACMSGLHGDSKEKYATLRHSVSIYKNACR